MENKYNDTEFMSANDKQLTAKQFDLFLRKGLKEKYFTDRLYKHFSLHCGFIAHYNRHGFYSTYFNSNAIDLKAFFDHFEKPWHYTNDYDDINTELSNIYHVYKDKIFSQANDNTDAKFKALQMIMKGAENDNGLKEKIVNAVNINL